MSEDEKGQAQDSERSAPSQEWQAELEPLLDEILSKSLEEERKLRNQVIADLRAARLNRDPDQQGRWWKRARAIPSRTIGDAAALSLHDPAPPSNTAPALISRLLERKGLRAAVVSPDQASRDELRACLDETGWVSSVEEWSGPSENHASIENGVFDLVLLDLLPDLETSLEFATQLHTLRPGTFIIACSQRQPDSDLVLEAMRTGVQEVLPKPLDANAVKSVLARLIQEHGELVKAPSKKAEKLILVMGSKGGVGTSTVAVNLGVQLAQITKKRVGLLDFARPWGQVDLLLDLQARFTIRNAVENVGKLDAQFFNQLLARHESGLEVLPGISSMQEGEQVSGQALGRIVNVAQDQFDYVLIDGGGIYSSDWGSILDFAPTILLVAGIYVPDFWALERHLAALAAHGVDPEQIRVVINRWHSCDEEALRKLEKILKHPIFARVPDDYRHVSQAVNSGVPLSKEHGGHLERSFRELAGQLIGVAPPADTRRSALNYLLPSIK